MLKNRVSEKQVKDKIEIQGIYSEGYGIIAKKVMRDQELSIGAKALYSYICSFAGAGESAWPGRETICKELGITKNTFAKYLNELKKENYVSVSQRKNEKGIFSYNVYTLVITPSPCPEKEDTAPCPQKPCPKKRDTVNEYTISNRSLIINNLEKQQRKDLDLKDLDLDQVTKREPDTDNAVVVLSENKNVKNQKPLIDKKTDIGTKETCRVSLDVGCQKMVIFLVKFGVDRQKAEQLVQTYDAKRIQQVLQYTQSKKPSSASGYIIRALENNWSIPEVATQIEEKEDLLKEQTRKLFKNLEQAQKKAEPAKVGTEHIGAILSRLKNSSIPSVPSDWDPFFARFGLSSNMRIKKTPSPRKGF
jgi:hypothetical protein